MSDKPVEVVAAVITDPNGRVLLARRTKGRDLAGLWEFPGGKREPGECAEAALARELHEELGITADIGPPLIRVPQRYPHKRLRLDVRRVSSWRGIPSGHEGQALAWVPPHMLPSYTMPPADRPVVAALLQPDRYLVTPPPGDDDKAWLQALERSLGQGMPGQGASQPDPPRVQLRDGGHCDATRWQSLVEQAVALCREASAEAMVNGDIALARSMGTGVHLRAAQLAALETRPLDSKQRVGASCHDLADLRHAQRLGCDFAVLGPVNATPTHPQAAGLGWDGFAALREEVSLPIHAIGGMSPADIPEARTHGAQGIAAIRSLWHAA